MNKSLEYWKIFSFPLGTYTVGKPGDHEDVKMYYVLCTA